MVSTVGINEADEDMKIVGMDSGAFDFFFFWVIFEEQLSCEKTLEMVMILDEAWRDQTSRNTNLDMCREIYT